MYKVDLPKSRVDSIRTKVSKEFIKSRKKIFANNDPLSVTLKAHLFVESLMDDILRDSSKNPNYALKRTFDQKVEILFFSSLFDENIYKKTKALNALRNKFAHDINYKLLRQHLDLFSSEKGRSNFDKLAAGIAYVIGYLHFLREINRNHPFAFTVTQKHAIYKKDRLFKYIEKELRSGLAKFKLEGWKMR